MALISAFMTGHPPLVVPEVGRGQEKDVQKTLDSMVAIGKKIEAIKPETIIVISPHSPHYMDYFHIFADSILKGNLSGFRASEVAIEKMADKKLVAQIVREAKKEGFPAGLGGQTYQDLDHGVLVPLYFVEKAYRDYKLVSLSIAGLPLIEHYRYGKIIARAIDALGTRAVLIASGDLSHRLSPDGPYGYAPEGEVFDRQVVKACQEGAFSKLLMIDETLAESAAECGLRSFVVMAGALDQKRVEPKFFSYEGPFGVGYANFSFDVKGEDNKLKHDELFRKAHEKELAQTRAQEDPHVALARKSLEHYIKTKKVLDKPKNLPEDVMQKKAGVFVSIKKGGRLRGCIGTIFATYDSIADEIIQNAIQAGTQDPRFPSVEAKELPELIYSVDVLSAPQDVADKSELDPKRYGVIVRKGPRRGLLLPNLPGIDTVEEQVAIALRKAGIAQHESYEMERFEVVRYE